MFNIDATVFTSFNFANSSTKVLDSFKDESSKNFLHIIYFSEFASLLVYGFVIYTSAYIDDNKYNKSTVSFEKISNIFKTKCPPFFCIVTAYITSEIINLLTNFSCLLKSIDTSIPPSAVIISIEFKYLSLQYL